MRHAYPLPFLHALLETADRCDLSNAAKVASTKLRFLIDSPPSAVYNRSMKELVPILAWGILEGEGVFWGPTSTYS